MQATKHRAEARSVVFIIRRMSDKVVVIGKNSPCFQTPIEGTANRKQSTMKHTQTSFGAKVMLFQVGANGEEVRAAHA